MYIINNSYRNDDYDGVKQASYIFMKCGYYDLYG